MRISIALILFAIFLLDVAYTNACPNDCTCNGLVYNCVFRRFHPFLYRNVTEDVFLKLKSTIQSNYGNNDIPRVSKLRIESVDRFSAPIASYAWNRSADHLEYLELNNVQVLDTTISFGQLTMLKTLKMTNVKLHRISSGTFRGMRNTLELLEMKNFNTGDVENLQFQDLASLTNLYFVHDNWDTYTFMNPLPNSLRTFKMQVLYLIEVPPPVANLTSLTVLNLENNEISDITNIPVELQTLRMRNNQVSHITEKSFKPNTLLQELSLQENRGPLTISKTAFINVPNIEKLNLTGTTFHAPVEAFTVLTKLTNMYVSPAYADYCIQVNKHFCDDVCTA